MTGYAKYVQAVLEKEPENRLLVARTLYEKSLATIPETSYYKTLERMSRDGFLVHLTKGIYLQKRNIPKEYNPAGAYDFENWKPYFDEDIRSRYETLHNDLLCTSERQDFDNAIHIFEQLSKIFSEIGE